MMKSATTNVYMDGDIWCHATWIDGEFDCSDPLDVPEDAVEADAFAAAEAMLAGRVESHEIKRVADAG